MLGIISLAVSAAATAFSAYKGHQAQAAQEKAIDRARDIAEERVDYIPMSDEEAQAITEWVDAMFQEQVIEQRGSEIEQMAAAGYDPEVAMGQITARFEPIRQRMINQTLLGLKAQDNVMERQHQMFEDMRVLQNQLALEMGEVQIAGQQEERAAHMWGGIAGLGAQVAGQTGLFEPSTDTQDTQEPRFRPEFYTPQTTPQTPLRVGEQREGSLRLPLWRGRGEQ